MNLASAVVTSATNLRRRKLGCAGALLFLLLPLAAFGADLPDSIAPASPASIRVLLDNGEEIETQRIRVRALGGLTLTGADGREQAIATKRVRKITDEYGDDKTKEVLVKEHGLRVGEPRPQKEPKVTPMQRGPFWSNHAGIGSALGSFKDMTEIGLALDLLVEKRPTRHETYGLRLDFAQFGGKHEVEDLMSANTGGAVNQLRYQLWGASVLSRYLIRPDHRLVPFIYTSLGVEGVATSLNGSGGRSSKTVYGLAQDAGIGCDVRLGGTTTAQLLAAYSRVVTKTNTVASDSIFVSTKGFEYLQFKAGLVRRF